MPAAFAAAGLGPDSVDAVLMNPPFNDPARHRISPDKARGIAHVATATTLANWVHAARRILKSRGALTLIWRADGIAEVLAALDHGFGSLEILPVHGDARAPANRILVRAVKGGRAPTQIHPALMLNDESGVPNKWVQEILAGNGACRWPGRKGGRRVRARSRLRGTLLRQRFRLPFRCRSEVNRGQQAADEHYQQIDFHVTLRCAIAASTAAMQKAFLPKAFRPLQ